MNIFFFFLSLRGDGFAHNACQQALFFFHSNHTLRNEESMGTTRSIKMIIILVIYKMIINIYTFFSHDHNYVHLTKMAFQKLVSDWEYIINTMLKFIFHSLGIKIIYYPQRSTQMSLKNYFLAIWNQNTEIMKTTQLIILSSKNYKNLKYQILKWIVCTSDAFVCFTF